MNYKTSISGTLNIGQNLVNGTFKSFENPCAVAYVFGFNGKEKLDEWTSTTGATYDYGFRIYDSRIGRFMSVDPLTNKFPFYTPYQFAGNKPTYALDLDGAEDYAYVYKMNSQNNGYTLVQVIDYTKTEAGTGPLGHGVYVSMSNSKGTTFNESFVSTNGNSINSFKNTNVNNTNLNKVSKGNISMATNLRLNGLLLQKEVQKGLVDLGFKKSDVESDIKVLDSDNPKFLGKFATFKEGTAEKYTNTWESTSFNNPNHKSTEEKTSGEIGNSDVLMKYYNGAESSTDNVPNHIGLVREGVFDHGVEAARAQLNSNVNIGVENANRVKQDTEKKK